MKEEFVLQFVTVCCLLDFYQVKSISGETEGKTDTVEKLDCNITVWISNGHFNGPQLCQAKVGCGNLRKRIAFT